MALPKIVVIALVKVELPLAEKSTIYHFIDIPEARMEPMYTSFPYDCMGSCFASLDQLKIICMVLRVN